MTWRLEPVVRLLLAAAALALGLLTLRVVRAQPGFALTPPDALGLTGLMLPGGALAGIGLVAWSRRQEMRAAAWFAAAGATWFLAEWNNPGAGSSIIFTTGLLLYAVTPALLVQGTLCYPAGRPDRAETRFLAVGYAVTVGGLGLLPAMIADPSADGCLGCPRDLVTLADHPALAAQALRCALALSAAWSVTAAVVLARRAMTAGKGLRRARAAVTCAVSLFLVLTAAAQLRLLDTGSLAVDEGQRRLRAAQAVALLLLAVAVAWGWTRRGRTRARVARLVLDLAATPPPGGLRDALADSLGDDTLRIGYWLTDGRLVDVAGHPLEVTGAATPLVRGRSRVALLVHRVGLLDDPRVIDEVAATARLALDNERLHAELAAQLLHLRESRQRVVSTADNARRRLERDLHDGAQQQLVGLLLRLRLDRASWPPDTDAATVARAAEVERELQASLESLRELARGIFPSALAEEGLASAVEDLAEGAAVPVTVEVLPETRAPSAVESASYFVVAESLRRTSPSAATVHISPRPPGLCVEMLLPGARAEASWVTALEDRVGALDGRVSVTPAEDGLAVRAVIPCGS